MFKNKPQWVK